MFSLKVSIFIGFLLVISGKDGYARPRTSAVPSTTTEDTMLLETQSSEEAAVGNDDTDIGYRPLHNDYSEDYDVIDYNSSTHSPLIHSKEYD